MKSLFIGIGGTLLFTIVSCFAIDQKLIDGFKAYEATMAEAHKIAETAKTSRISSDESEELWHKVTNYDLPIEVRTAAENKLEENQKLVKELWAQYYELRTKAEKLEPLKDEYDRQDLIEYEKEQTRINIIALIVILLLFVGIFGAAIRFSIIQHRKYQRLLKEGKITQEEYDRIMEENSRASVFQDDYRTNPATGMRMLGGCDVGGNPYGSSSRSSSCSSDNYKTRYD